MSDQLRLLIDSTQIASRFGELKERVQEALQKGVQALAMSTNAKAHELAASQLKTTSKKFRDALSFDSPAEGIYVVTLKEEMLWREEGILAHSMVDDMLKKNYKVAKDGSKYKVIPFKHEGGPTQNSPKQMSFLNILKSFLKENKINYKKVENGPDGKPLIGKLHSFNVPSPRPTRNARFPVFSGLNIYQTQNKETGKVQRSLVTFRIVSDKHKSQGRWFHPGLQAAKILDASLDWAVQAWETEVLPNILAEFQS